MIGVGTSSWVCISFSWFSVFYVYFLFCFDVLLYLSGFVLYSVWEHKAGRGP